MKKGETLEAYIARKTEEWDNIIINRLRGDERYLEMQLANVRRKIEQLKTIQQKERGAAQAVSGGRDA